MLLQRLVPRIVKTVRYQSKARLFRSCFIRHQHLAGNNHLLIETYDKIQVIQTNKRGSVGLLQGFWFPVTDPTKTVRCHSPIIILLF